MELPQIDDYQRLFLDDIPMMDVRAPVEFARGAFPHAENLPLMNDEERRDIGICYKAGGQDGAIKLGHELVSGPVKQDRVCAWQQFVEKHPDGVLYCFRGGLRSKISQQWIYEQTGVVYPRVKGGYQAMRRFLINELETAAQTLQPVILSGRSGVGKTLLLKRIQRKIDLEHIYNHRGSVFGIHATPQPSQINVDNQLAITLLKFRHQNIIRLVFEDESANIGSRRIPESLLAMLQRAPLVVLETNDNERVDITFEEYVTSALAEYQSMYGEASGFAQWANYLLTAVDSIKRRLGGERHSRIKQIMENAIENHRQLGDTSAHRDWIYALLTNYYDPMYNYQLSNKAERVEFQGGGEAVLEYLRHKFGIS